MGMHLSNCHEGLCWNKFASCGNNIIKVGATTMRQFDKSLLLVVAACATIAPAQAQTGSQTVQEGGAAAGAQCRQTDTTWQDVEQMPAYGNVQAELGNTFRTDTQGFADLNGPALPASTTALEAPRSGMSGTIPTSQFNFGFPNGGADTYRGPYSGSTNAGGTLPATSTRSANPDICGGVSPMARSSSYIDRPDLPAPSWGYMPNADGGGTPNRKPEDAGTFASEREMEQWFLNQQSTVRKPEKIAPVIQTMPPPEKIPDLDL